MSAEIIRAVQHHIGIEADGVAGPVTWNAIAKALGLHSATSSLKVNAATLNLIKEFEGFHKVRSDGMVEAYPDPATGGVPWTIGYGTTGPDVKRGTVWTKAQAEQRFNAHVAEFAEGVRKLIGSAPTTDNQFGAMVSLAYNVGLGNFKESTLRRIHLEGNHAGAKAQFSRWNKAAGKVMAGLTRRRTAEAALYGS